MSAACEGRIVRQAKSGHARPAVWTSLLLLLAAIAAPAWADTARLLILHTADLHDHVRAGDHGVGGLPYVSGYIRQVRAERNDVLVVDSGDVAEKGDLVAFRTHSELTYEALRRIGFDAITIGNHEHDEFGHAGLRRFEGVLGQPLLCRNVLNPDGTAAFQPSRMVEVNGIRIGLVGLITPRKEQGLDFAASGEALAREARALKTAGAAVVVAVCHEGASRCAEWSRVAPEVDVFAAGHSHEALHMPRVVPETGAIIVQSGSYARWVGRLELEIDRSAGKIVRHEGRLVEMRHDAVPVDAEMLAWVRQREQELAPEARDLVFDNPAEIDGFSIGRIGAEALRLAAAAEVGFCHPYQIIRNILPAGRVDVNAVFKTGGDRGHDTVIVELTGAQIEGYADALERIQREPPEWAGFRMWREATPGGDVLRTNLESGRRYRVIMAKLEWETRFLRLAEKVRERDPTHAFASAAYKAAPGRVTFTDAVCAYIRQVVAEGHTVQQRLEELGQMRQEAAGGTLRLSVTDGEGGPLIPARIELLSADGRAYVAEDALPVGPGYPERYVPWEGDFAKALTYLSREIHNPFTQTTQFYTVGASNIALPAGEYRLRVFKGIEYKLAARTLRIAAGQTTELAVPLVRWIDLPAMGWYSSDDHMHISRPVKELDPLISKWMQAEDIHVANLLQFGTWRTFSAAPQHAFGPEGVYREGDHLLVSGQENPRTDFLGHTIVLGGQRPIQFSEEYEIFRRFWEEARRQGALSGYAHWGTASEAQNGLAVDLPDGLLDFLEVLECWDANYTVWYEILNSGIRMTPTAGTDYGTLPNLPGRERFYTAVDGPLSVGSWLDGIRRGATFVTNGPILEFFVNGKGLGEELALEKAAQVRVQARVHFDPERDDVFRLEVVQNGTLIRSIPRVGDESVIRCEFDLPVDQACWLAARITGSKVGEVAPPEGFIPPFRNRKRGEAASHAHTAAFFITVAGAENPDARFRARDSARVWLARLDELERRMADDNLRAIARENDHNRPTLEHLLKIQPAMLEAIARARQFYLQRLE